MAPPTLSDKTVQRNAKNHIIPLLFAASADGGDDDYHPFPILGTGRIPVDIGASISLGDLEINLDYAGDEVTVLYGDPSDGTVESNPSYTVARNADGTIASVTVPEWGVSGLTRTITRNASSLITAVSSWA